MMNEAKSYKWLNRLINKITKVNAPLDNEFDYRSFHVSQTSGMRDYTSVAIYENYMEAEQRQIVGFSFDFITMKLSFNYYCDTEIRQSVIEAFLRCYNEIHVTDSAKFFIKEVEDAEKLITGWLKNE